MLTMLPRNQESRMVMHGLFSGFGLNFLEGKGSVALCVLYATFSSALLREEMVE